MRPASALIVGGSLLAGCASVWGFDDLTAGDASAGGDASLAESGADQQSESLGSEGSSSSGASSSSSSGSSSGSGGPSSSSGSSSGGSSSGSGSSGGSSSGSSSGSGSGSSSGGSSSGSSSGGQTGTDCPGNFLLCDGFESDAIDTTTKWQAPNCTTLTSMGIGTIAHSGSYSLHVHVAALPGSSLASCVLATKQTSIFSSTPMYFRAWVYMTAYSGAAATEPIIAAQSSGGAAGSIGIGSTGLFATQVTNDGGNDYSHTAQSSPGLPLNAWACLELEIDTDYATYPNGLLAAWDDTSGTADAQLGGTAALQPLVSSTFGLSFNGPSLATDLYIDDIAISNTYVPCSQ
jgi:hypothetical protein